MPRTSTAAVVPIAQHKPYVPPMAHKVHITAPYLPACATNVAATIERVRNLLASQAAGRRKPRRVDARLAPQVDMFPSTVLRVVEQQQRRVA